MNYILTQEELDALKNHPRAAAKEVLAVLSKHLIVQKVCIDLMVGQQLVIFPTDYQSAIEKTIEHYATK